MIDLKLHWRKARLMRWALYRDWLGENQKLLAWVVRDSKQDNYKIIWILEVSGIDWKIEEETDEADVKKVKARVETTVICGMEPK